MCKCASVPKIFCEVCLTLRVGKLGTSDQLPYFIKVAKMCEKMDSNVL